MRFVTISDRYETLHKHSLKLPNVKKNYDYIHIIILYTTTMHHIIYFIKTFLLALYYIVLKFTTVF